MPGILDSLTSGAGDIFSSALSAFGGYSGASAANSANSANFQQQMNFEQGMRSTQYQTAVADLQKAGLNPMLAYTHGGAGTPPAPSAQPYQSPVGHAISSAHEGRQAHASVMQKAQEVAASKQGVTIKSPLAAVAENASTAVETVKALIPAISDGVAQAVMKVEDTVKGKLNSAAAAAADPNSALGVAAHAVLGRADTPLRGAQDFVSKLVDGATSSAAGAAAVGSRAAGFKGKYSDVMSEINRISNVSDRKAARAQYIKQITR